MNGIDRLLGGQRVMAILRGLEPEAALQIAVRAWDLGIDLVEVTVQEARFESSLAAVVAEGVARAKPVAAGTVTTVRQVELAADLGCAFTVAPGLDRDVVEACRRRGVEHIPGVATATEIQAASSLGLRWVKVFPAASLGAPWIRSMKAPFPQIRIVATGGIDARNAAEFLDAGADLVAVGSALEDASQLEALAGLLDPHDQTSWTPHGRKPQ